MKFPWGKAAEIPPTLEAQCPQGGRARLFGEGGGNHPVGIPCLPLPPAPHWGVGSANTSPQKGTPYSPPWACCARQRGGPSFFFGGGGVIAPPPPGNAQGRGSLAGATASVKTNYVALCCPWLAVVFFGGCCCFVVVENLWWKNKPIIRRLGWLVLAPWAKWRKMGGKAKVVPQACGQPQACRWGVRGALPIGGKVFWRPLHGILFTENSGKCSFPPKKNLKKKDKNCAP